MYLFDIYLYLTNKQVTVPEAMGELEWGIRTLTVYEHYWNEVGRQKSL